MPYKLVVPSYIILVDGINSQLVKGFCFYRCPFGQVDMVEDFQIPNDLVLYILIMPVYITQFMFIMLQCNGGI